MPPSSTTDSRAWWVTAFGPLYLTVYGHRDEAEARRFAPSIARMLALRPSGRVLDVACGSGRYSRAFASLGYRVTGVDLSSSLLDAANAASAGLPGSPTYIRSDMRALPFAEQFEGAVSLFTSFGYFDDRGEDLRHLASVHRALVPGGRFVLDFLNEPSVRANLVPESTEERSPCLVKVRRRIDDGGLGGPYVRKDVEIVDSRTHRTLLAYEERVRLYSPDGIDEALRNAGFALVNERYGDLEGSPWTASSPRCVRVAERPRRPGASPPSRNGPR